MRALIQRVHRASVVSSVDGGPMTETGRIRTGLCTLIGVTHDDTAETADKLAAKIFGIRIFDDDDGVMNRSLADIARTGAEAAVLVVSQFTLYGDTTKGRRPSWGAAARPSHAEPLVERVVEQLRLFGAVVETGQFRTEMEVSLVNHGPVTLMIEI